MIYYEQFKSFEIPFETTHSECRITHNIISKFHLLYLELSNLRIFSSNSIYHLPAATRRITFDLPNKNQKQSQKVEEIKYILGENVFDCANDIIMSRTLKRRMENGFSFIIYRNFGGQRVSSIIHCHQSSLLIL